MPDVTLTVDGKIITAPAGTLLIDACKSSGIEIPAFCYYPGLSLQAACRMCLVRIDKIGKLQTACTTTVAEGMVVHSETPEIAESRKAMIQMVLANHPLDCPVCDAGGECELQDMTFKYGAADSFFAEPKNHREEQKWSPAVFFDRPRCILCYRCVRVCGEGMDVFALGIQNRNSSSTIAPNVPADLSPDNLAHLDCEQCGMCIDVCPVGALTSGTYRYKTRPWEMNHVSTICTHCGDGCKTTLGVRSTSDGSEIVRGDNRDKSGINGDFLCNKGRYSFDFANNDDRITHPLVRQPNGELKPVSWEDALDHVGKRLRELRDQRGGKSIGVIGGNRLTNEEAYLLQKFARTVLGTNNIDHHRTADYVAFAQALAGHADRTASLRDTLTAPAILLVGGDPTNQAPATAWNIRTNVRHNRTRLYVANSAEIKLRRQAKVFVHLAPFGYEALAAYLAGDDAAASGAVSNTSALAGFRDSLKAEENLLIVIGSELRGAELKKLIDFGLAIPGAKFALLSGYANSRGAADMGLLPDMLPGYTPVTGNETFAEYNAPAEPGLDMLEIFEAAGRGELSALYVVGSNPVARYSVDPAALKNTFVVVQEMFLTETAALADVILPAANLYEKSGSVTNSYGDLQQVSKAGDRAGVRTDFEMIVRIADKMGADMHALVPFGKGPSGTRADMGQSRGVHSGEADRHAVWLTANNMEPKLSPFDPYAILDEIQRLVPGYNLLRLQLLSGNDQHLQPAASGLSQIGSRRDLVLPANDTLFTSGTLGRYSTSMNDLRQHQENQKSAQFNETVAD
ncbi:MAG: molybdopterin-dependent oxidoreductase [Edaphobacter sp.]